MEQSRKEKEMKQFLDDLIEGLARWGYAYMGLTYPPDSEENTLP